MDSWESDGFTMMNERVKLPSPGAVFRTTKRARIDVRSPALIVTTCSTCVVAVVGEQL